MEQVYNSVCPQGDACMSKGKWVAQRQDSLRELVGIAPVKRNALPRPASCLREFCVMNKSPYNPEISRLVDLAVLGSERTTGTNRALWLRLLSLLLKLAGL